MHFSSVVLATVATVLPTVLARPYQDVVSTRNLNLVPQEVYGPKDAPIILRFGNGGAGPTGILGALALDYLHDRGLGNASIAWYQNISPLTLQALELGELDLAFTYERDQEAEAVAAGYVQEARTAFHDHFVLVGPRSNPAGVQKNGTAMEAMAKIGQFAETSPSVPRFFSRDDNSATNVKEIQLWRLAGFEPFVGTRPAWYLAMNVFPQDALRLADQSGIYVLTDHGTFYRTRAEIVNSEILFAGGEILLNTCNAVLRTNPSDTALDFIAYIESPNGQRLIAEFGKEEYGTPLFTPVAQPEFLSTTLQVSN